MATEEDPQDGDAEQERTVQTIQPREYPLITRAELAGSYFNKYVLFAILLPNTTDKYIRRRYSDFVWLRNNLTQRYIGIFIPPIPPKVPIAMWPKGYLQIRKQELQLFLRRCVQIPYLKDDEVVQFWLKDEGDKFDKVRKAWDKEHPKFSTNAQIDLLKTTFPELSDAEAPANFEEDCEQQTRYVTEAFARLQAMLDCSKRLVDKYQQMQGVAENMQEAFKANQKSEREFAGVEISAEAQKRMVELIPEQRVDISDGIAGWTAEWETDAQLMQQNLCSCVKKNMMDMQALVEICEVRDKSIAEWNNVKVRAQGWRDRQANGGPDLKRSEIAKKSTDLSREEELTKLVKILANVSKDQLRRNWQKHARLWAFNTKNFVQGHHQKYQRLKELWKSTQVSATQEPDCKPFAGVSIKL